MGRLWTDIELAQHLHEIANRKAAVMGASDKLKIGEASDAIRFGDLVVQAARALLDGSGSPAQLQAALDRMPTLTRRAP